MVDKRKEQNQPFLKHLNRKNALVNQHFLKAISAFLSIFMCCFADKNKYQTAPQRTAIFCIGK